MQMRLDRLFDLEIEQTVRIANPVSPFNGEIGIIKDIREGGGLTIEIKGRGKLVFSVGECRPV